MQQYVKTGIKDFKAFPVFLVCKIIMNGNWCTTISSATYVAELTVVFFHFLFFPLISQYNIAKPAIEQYYAYSPVHGLHKWVGTKWESLEEKPKDALSVPLHQWMDKMN